MKRKLAAILAALAIGSTLTAAPAVATPANYCIAYTQYPYAVVRVTVLPIPNAYSITWVKLTTGAVHTHYC